MTSIVLIRLPLKEDNLCTKDNVAAPGVYFVWRFHCKPLLVPLPPPRGLACETS